MFTPGETITHDFFIPFVPSDLSEVYVTYKQNDHVVYESPAITEFTAEENNYSKFSITFTQMESLMFRDGQRFFIQVNVITQSGGRFTSSIIRGENGDQYKREVISSG